MALNGPTSLSQLSNNEGALIPVFPQDPKLTCPISRLPNDIIAMICEYSEEKELRTLTATCQAFRRLIRQEGFTPANCETLYQRMFRRYSLCAYDRKIKNLFLWAVKHNFFQKVVELLSRIGAEGLTPLPKKADVFYLAARGGYTKVFKILLSSPGGNPSLDQNRALRIAAQNGFGDIVSLLLDDERVDPSIGGRRAIQDARAQSHFDCVKKIKHHPRFKNVLETEKSHLQEKKWKLIKRTREKILAGDMSCHNSEVLITACRCNQGDVVEILLQDERIDPASENNKPFIVACEKGFTAIVKRLLKKDSVDPSAMGNIAIQRVSENGHEDLVSLLLKDPFRRANPSANDNFAIKRAARNGHLGIVKLLIADNRVDPSAEESCALRGALEEGHIDIVDELLRDGRVDPTANDNEALKLAIEMGLLGLVDKLLSYPAVNPSAGDNAPLKSAMRKGYDSLFNKLLADPRLRFTSRGSEELKIALRIGRLEIVGPLLEDRRIDPSFEDNYALSFAIVNEDEPLASKLLDDPSVNLDVDGPELIKSAVEYGHQKMALFLLEHKKFKLSSFIVRDLIKWAKERQEAAFLSILEKKALEMAQKNGFSSFKGFMEKETASHFIELFDRAQETVRSSLKRRQKRGREVSVPITNYFPPKTKSPLALRLEKIRQRREGFFPSEFDER